jgi:hypothetical protein
LLNDSPQKRQILHGTLVFGFLQRQMADGLLIATAGLPTVVELAFGTHLTCTALTCLSNRAKLFKHMLHCFHMEGDDTDELLLF